jgi:hypothetical protein
MDALTLFGLFSVSAMLVCYSLESRSYWFVLLFACVRSRLRLWVPSRRLAVWAGRGGLVSGRPYALAGRAKILITTDAPPEVIPNRNDFPRRIGIPLTLRCRSRPPVTRTAGIEALTSRNAPTVTSETGWRALRNGTGSSLQSNAKACSSSRAASLKSFNGSMP